MNAPRPAKPPCAFRTCRHPATREIEFTRGAKREVLQLCEEHLRLLPTLGRMAESAQRTEAKGRRD
jgi:hypothetical protein